MRRRVVLIGFDGLDFDAASSFLDVMPNLRSMREKGVFAPLRSVFPPDSIPSWITGYTGLDPSEHGVLESVNYLAKGDGRLKVDNSVFAGKTFWDVVGAAGKQVCIINPFLAYPVWKVNGVMVNGPVFIGGDVTASDPAILEGTPIPASLGGITDFPTRSTLAEFVSKTLDDTREQAAFGLEAFRRSKADLFFQAFLTTDRMQHFLWRYCDPGDPTWPGKNPFENAIRDMYAEADRILGLFGRELSPQDILIAISDHGHGMRCTHCFNLNEYLRRKGLVVSLAGGKTFSRKLLVEKLKNRVLKFMNEHDMEDYISVVARFVPNAKALKKGRNITDRSRNIAYASDFAGTNPFGGITINRQLTSDYDRLRSSLIDELATVEHGGEKVFRWLAPREDMYAGEHLDRLPDILFGMEPCYGVNWSMHTDLVTPNPTHKKISGGHKPDGVLVMNMPAAASPDAFSMTNLYATVLGLFGLPSQHGRSWVGEMGKRS